LIKILIVNFHHDLIMPNTGCAVLCNNFTKEKRIYEHTWTYFIYNYWCFQDCYVLRLLYFFFSILVFWNLEMR